MTSKAFDGVFTLEQSALLFRLIDWWFGVPPGILKLNGGDFYCSTRHLERLYRGLTRRVQERLFRELEALGYLRTWMRYGGRRAGGTPFDNQRMIRLNTRKLYEEAYRAEQKAEQKRDAWWANLAEQDTQGGGDQPASALSIRRKRADGISPPGANNSIETEEERVIN
jgi:hypothetical protein